MKSYDPLIVYSVDFFHRGGGALQWAINGPLMAQNGIFLFFLPCIAGLKHLGCLIPMPNDFL